MNKLGKVIIVLVASISLGLMYQTPVSADQTTPQVVETNVTGEPDTNTTGVEVFDPVTVSVKTNHFTNDNLLTEDGLGWTDQTQVIPIKGQAVGEINNQKYWGQNNPTVPTTAPKTATCQYG